MTVESAIMDSIRRWAQASGTEICGALLSRNGRLEEAVPLANESPAQTHSFYIPAREVLQLEQTAEAQGRVLAGFYHSHPHGDAVPSGSDLESAVPGYVYIIAARTGLMRAWRLRDDRRAFDEMDLTEL